MHLSQLQQRLLWARPPLSASTAGHGVGPAQPLKVETRVRTPLGLRVQTPRSRAESGMKSAPNTRLVGR